MVQKIGYLLGSLRGCLERQYIHAFYIFADLTCQISNRHQQIDPGRFDIRNKLCMVLHFIRTKFKHVSQNENLTFCGVSQFQNIQQGTH